MILLIYNTPAVIRSIIQNRWNEYAKKKKQPKTKHNPQTSACYSSAQVYLCLITFLIIASFMVHAHLPLICRKKTLF